MKNNRHSNHFSEVRYILAAALFLAGILTNCTTTKTAVNRTSKTAIANNITESEHSAITTTGTVLLTAINDDVTSIEEVVTVENLSKPDSAGNQHITSRSVTNRVTIKDSKNNTVINQKTDSRESVNKNKTDQTKTNNNQTEEIDIKKQTKTPTFVNWIVVVITIAACIGLGVLIYFIIRKIKN
jgi:cobalamin biosynthesis Mg chelatase CobN